MMIFPTWSNAVYSSRTTYTAVVLAAFTMVGFFVSGFPLVGHDSYFHLNQLAQYHAAQRDGSPLPRWAMNAYYGFGSAAFYFYPPLLNLTASLCSSVTNSYPWAIRATGILSVIGMVFSFRDYLSAIGASHRMQWVASIAYATSPYAFFDYAVRGCYSEFYAMAFIPLLLSGVERILRASAEYDPRGLLRILAGSVFLVLSSIPVSALCLITLSFYIAVRLPRSGWRRARSLAYMLARSLGCLAFYLFPIVELHNDVHLQHIICFHQNSQFRNFALASALSPGANTGNITDSLLLLLTLFALIISTYRWRQKRDVITGSMILPLCFTMLLHIPFVAAPLADAIPLVSLIQFPCRAYIFTSVCVGILLGTTKDANEKRQSQSLSYLTVGITVFLVASLASLYFMRSLQNAPIENPPRANAFEYVPAAVPGSAESVAAYARAHEADPDVWALDELQSGEKIEQIESKSESSRYSVMIRKAHPVRFHLFYWSRWKLARTNGDTIHTYADGHGMLCATLPEGSFDLQLTLIHSPMEQAGFTISTVCIACTIITMMLHLKNSNKKPTLVEKTGVGSQDKRTRSRSAWLECVSLSFKN
jgi:hypothetical protein